MRWVKAAKYNHYQVQSMNTTRNFMKATYCDHYHNLYKIETFPGHPDK